MARESNEIDREKSRAEVRRLGNEYVLYMLDDAIELLPPAKLHKIAKKYIDLKRLRPDAEKATKASLLTDVQLFEKASLAREDYESFQVNSRNYTQQSAGTSSWIAAFRRLLDRCVANAKRENPTEVREAMDILFGLLNIPRNVENPGQDGPGCLHSRVGRSRGDRRGRSKGAVLCGECRRGSAMRVAGESKEESEACRRVGWRRKPALHGAGLRSGVDELRAGRRGGVVAVQSPAVEGEPHARPT